jgi:hypothetical protein
MRNPVSIVCLIATIMVVGHVAGSSRPAPQNGSTQMDPISMVIIFKDGHEKTFSMADISRVEYRAWDEEQFFLG